MRVQDKAVEDEQIWVCEVWSPLEYQNEDDSIDFRISGRNEAKDTNEELV